jgi:mono/diheme cytochrome c family protein
MKPIGNTAGLPEKRGPELGTRLGTPRRRAPWTLRRLCGSERVTCIDFFLIALISLLSAGVSRGQVKLEATPGTTGPDAVARGKYIVEDVAMCEQCHTRRDENGKPDLGNWLMGGPVQIKPTYPAPDWAVRVPRIAGEPPGTEADFIRLLTTGIARTGKPPKPPMHQFHMTREDAEAVYAYLKTLGP